MIKNKFNRWQNKSREVLKKDLTLYLECINGKIDFLEYYYLQADLGKIPKTLVKKNEAELKRLRSACLTLLSSNR